jgi:hypothetical protein
MLSNLTTDARVKVYNKVKVEFGFSGPTGHWPDL